MDYRTDRTFNRLQELKSLNLLPSYVNLLTDDITDTTVYANKYASEYPLNNKSNVFKSALHYACVTAVNPDECSTLNKDDIEGLIKQACIYHGITNDVVDACHTITNKNIKTASVETFKNQKFALRVFEQGKESNCLPINTLDEIEDAAIKLAEFKDFLPAPYYYDACVALTDEYNKYAGIKDREYVFIPNSVLEDGTTYILDENKFASILDERKMLTNDVRYDELKRDLIKKASSVDQDYLQQLKYDIFDIDLEHQLHGDYHKPDSKITNQFKFAHTPIKLTDAIDTLTTNVKLASVMIPLNVFAKSEITDAIPNLIADDLAKGLLQTIKTASNSLDISDYIEANLNDYDQKLLLELIVKRG